MSADDLAHELLAGLHAPSETGMRKLWLDKAIRRDAELDSRAARAHPADDVLDRAGAKHEPAACDP